MLNPTEAALESQAQKIARIITREYGIEVRVEGGLAYIDLEKRIVVIPELSEAERVSLGDTLDGFLDHECGHAIYTDVTAFKNSGLKTGEPIHTVWNVIEDYWTEVVNGEARIGCKQNLARLNNKMTKDLLTKWDDMDTFNKLLFGMARIWRGEASLADYSTDSKIGDILPLLSAELSDGYGVRSTQAAIDLARRIMAKIQKLADENKERKKQQKGEPSKEESLQTQTPENGQEREEGHCGGFDMGDEDGPQEKSPKASQGEPGEDSGEGEDGEAEDDKGTTDGGKSTLEKGLEQAGDLQEELATGAVQDNKMDKENYLNRNLDNIRDCSTTREPEDYLVFSEEFDTDYEYSDECRASNTELYKKLKAEVSDYIGNMANMLSLALLAESECRWVGGARKGRKWDKRQLPQWYLGDDDDRLWKYQEQGEQWDTAVCLLWDCSGSMGSNVLPGSKSALARVAAIAFHEALLQVGIAHEVLGFNTGGTVPKELHKKVATARNNGMNLDRYSRLARTDKRMVFVPYGESDGRAICEIDGRNFNRDGECVLWAAKRLAARPEKRKILIVGSDGQPRGALYPYTEKKYLQDTIKRIIDSGIEVLAIGIKNPKVKLYYPNWVLVNDATELPTVVIEQLSQQLFNKGVCNGKFPDKIRQTN